LGELRKNKADAVRRIGARRRCASTKHIRAEVASGFSVSRPPPLQPSPSSLPDELCNIRWYEANTRTSPAPRLAPRCTATIRPPPLPRARPKLKQKKTRKYRPISSRDILVHERDDATRHASRRYIAGQRKPAFRPNSRLSLRLLARLDNRLLGDRTTMIAGQQSKKHGNNPSAFLAARTFFDAESRKKKNSTDRGGVDV